MSANDPQNASHERPEAPQMDQKAVLWLPKSLREPTSGPKGVWNSAIAPTLTPKTMKMDLKILKNLSPKE